MTPLPPGAQWVQDGDYRLVIIGGICLAQLGNPDKKRPWWGCVIFRHDDAHIVINKREWGPCEVVKGCGACAFADWAEAADWTVKCVLEYAAKAGDAALMLKVEAIKHKLEVHYESLRLDKSQRVLEAGTLGEGDQAG